MEKLGDKLARLGGLSQRPMPTPEPEKPREMRATFEVVIREPKRLALKSAHVDRQAFEMMVTDKAIQRGEMVVYIFLTFNMNIKTGQSHRLKRSEIVNGTELSDRQVRRSLQKLTEKGFIKPLEEGKGKHGMLMYELVTCVPKSDTDVPV